MRFGRSSRICALRGRIRPGQARRRPDIEPHSANALILALALVLAPGGARTRVLGRADRDSSLEPADASASRLCNGDGFEGWSLARDARRIEEFVAGGAMGAAGRRARRIRSRGRRAPRGSGRLHGRLPQQSRNDRGARRGVRQYLKRRGWRTVRRARQEGCKAGSVREAYSRYESAGRVGNRARGASTARSGSASSSLRNRACRAPMPDASRSFRCCIAASRLQARSSTAMRPGTPDTDLNAAPIQRRARAIQACASAARGASPPSTWSRPRRYRRRLGEPVGLVDIRAAGNGSVVAGPPTPDGAARAPVPQQVATPACRNGDPGDAP